MPEIHTLQITPIERFSSSNGGAIKRPTEITHFSYTPNAPLPSNAPPVSNLRDALPHQNENELPVAVEPAGISHSRVRQIHHDSRGIKYYYGPQLGASLSEGFDTFQQVDDGKDEHLDGLLASLTHLEQGRASKRQKLSHDGVAAIEDTVEAGMNGQDGEAMPDNWRTEADIVTWRGMITKIMAAPYQNFDGFEMNATLFEDTIYLEESHEAKLTSRAKQESQKPRPGQASQELMSYWGHKFETLSLLPATWDDTSRYFIETRPQHYVNNYEQYISIVQTGIGGLKMVLGGEVDAVWDVLPSDPEVNRPNYTELKTASARLLPHPNAHPSAAENFDRKLLKFWIQSFLLGVPKIIVGFRTNDMEGRLMCVREYATTALPRMVKERAVAQGRRPVWEREICVGFAGEFLRFLRDIVRREAASVNVDGVARKEGGTWKIRQREKSNVVEIFKVEESGFGDILSREFVAWRRTGDPLAARREGALERLGGLRGSIWDEREVGE